MCGELYPYEYRRDIPLAGVEDVQCDTEWSSVLGLPLKSGAVADEGPFIMALSSNVVPLSEFQFDDFGVQFMQMLYNSDNYAVVQIELSQDDAPQLPQDATALTRGGYEIVDKFARKEMFIEGALAESFKEGVEALIENSPSVEEFDAYLERYAGMATQPVVMH